MSRSDAEILDLLRAAKPDDARPDAQADDFARQRPASSFTAGLDVATTGRRSRAVPVTLALAAAVTLVAVGVVAAVILLRSRPADPTLVPASQPSPAPETTAAVPDTSAAPDPDAVVVPPDVVGQAGPGEGNGPSVARSGGPASPSGVGLETAGDAPPDPLAPAPGGPAIPPVSAPAVGVAPIDANVVNRKPLPFCGTIVADDASGVDDAERAMVDCYWALVDANVPAEVIWTGHDGTGSSFTLIVRHTGDRRGETGKQYRDATGAYAWFVQRCTNQRRGLDLIAVDRAQTVCGPDEPL